MPKLYKFLTTFCLILTAAADNLSAADYYRGLTLNICTGPSYLTGFYSDYFKNGLNTETGAFYNLPFLNGNTYLTGGLSYYRYRMDSSSGSVLQQGDIFAGGMFAYPVASYIFINAGISLRGIYSVLDTDNTNRHETTLKPGCSASLGSMAYLGRGIGLFINTEYRITELSSREFEAFTVKGGLTYNFTDYRSDIEDRLNSDKKIALFDRGNIEFRKKNFDEAKKIFTELYKMDPDFPGLDYNMKRIQELEESYKTAEKFIEQKNYLRAIPHLDNCAPFIKDCELKLLQQRKSLQSGVAAWVKEGVRYYDNRQYKECINIMEKVLLVDPENRDANIYLPRAVKRNKAIESLQSE